MNRKSLSVEDRRAIDLILNHGSAHASGPTQLAAGASQARVAAASRLLSMLDTLPALEPSSDLVARTLSRIDAASRLVTTAPATDAATAAVH